MLARQIAEGQPRVIHKKHHLERCRTHSSAWEQSGVSWGWEVRQKILALSLEHRQ